MNPEITIYGDIGGDDESSVTVRSVSAALAEIGLDATEIDVRINSQGGSVSQGVAIARLLRQHPAKIHTIIEGGAFSIAGYIACSGDRRTICGDSMLHIHGPQRGTEGNLEDHEDAIKELQIATKVMAERYAEISGQSTDNIKSSFHRDLFFDAEEAVAMGYMTEIGSESKVAALVDSKQFNQIPKKFAAALARKPSESKPIGDDEMSTTKTGAVATAKQMRASFKRANAEFILDQLESGATLTSATAAYVKAMEDELEAMDEEASAEEKPEDVIARLTAQVKALKAKAEGDDELEAEDDDEITAEDDDELTAEEEEEVEAMEELKALRAEVAKLKGPKAKSKNRKRVGARAFRKSNRQSKSVARGTAKAEVHRQASAMMETNKRMSRQQAVMAVYKADPDLHDRYIDEANAG